MTADQRTANLLEVRGLTKIFGTLKACDRVDLTVARGEIHALLGENGAGKSTLVKMLFGSLEPHSGEIFWNGEAVSITSPGVAKKLGVGMVFQHFSLFEALTAAENIALSLDDGSPIGTILSSGGFFGMLFLVGQTNFEAWGWRIPFIAAIPLLAISLWIRSRLSESPEFEALMESGETEHAPIRGVLRNSWRQILVGMCSALLGIGGFYLITSFVVFYGTKILKMPFELLLLGTLLAAALEIGALIWAGRLGEKFGASKVILWGGVASALVAVPVFLAIDSRDPVLVVLGMMIGVAVLSIPYAVSGTALTALFATKVRYTGVAITSNTAGVISGFVPLIATALVAANGNSFWPGAIILLVVSALTALSGLFLPSLSIEEEGMKH